MRLAYELADGVKQRVLPNLVASAPPLRDSEKQKVQKGRIRSA